jgi:FkbM family methyltransferase
MRKKLLEDNRFAGLATHFRYRGGYQRALDIGAFNGVFAMNFARFFDQVVAFEPNDQIVMRDARQFGNIQFEFCALSDYVGTGRFTHIKDRPAFNCLDFEATRESFENYMAREDPDFVPEMRYRDVQIRTIDSYEFDSVDFIKIDAEGNTTQILEGGLETITKFTPTIQAELILPERSQVIEWLADQGYQLLFSDTWIGRHMHPENCYPERHYTDGFFVHRKYNPRIPSC